MRLRGSWTGVVGVGVVLAALCSGACGGNETLAISDGGASTGTGGAGGGLLAGSDCDPLVPTVCGMPFPNDVWTEEAPDSPTGKRVTFGATTLPEHASDGHLDPAAFAAMDGFSVGQAPLAHLPGATVEGLPSLPDLQLSLSTDSPTVLIEAETGKAVPHFAELDMTGPADDDRAFMLRPVVRLADATRYIVAIRRVVSESGVALEPSEVFKALRDGTEHEDPSVAARRDLYADIFAKLQAAGYDTSDLQLAWDFTTASGTSKTQWMLHMRDDALEQVGEAGPTYVVTEVIEDPNANIRRRIRGVMTVPLYLDTAQPGGKLVFGDDGMPARNGTAEFEFEVQVPHAATGGTPGANMQNGHGLLGKHTEGHDGYLAEIANRHNFVTIAVDFIGFAAEDQDVIIDAISSDFTAFDTVIQRKHQAVVNSLLAMRMMKGSFWMDPNVQFDGQSAIDPSQAYYRGDSQGGIYGATYMALTTDVTRGLLGEPGAPYNLLLNRSADFPPFFLLLKLMFKRYVDIQMVLAAAQMFWDRADPNTYLPHITDNPLPNTPSHNVLLHVAIGDQQVTPYAAHLMARELGAVNVSPVNRTVWDVPEQQAPITSGNAMVEFRFDGVPEVPLTNVPPMQPPENDPHDWVRVLDAAYDQTNTFLRTGVIEQYCAGPCDPE